MRAGGSRPAALVTGGSRGIGAATALALAQRGCDVAFTYRNKVARANGVATMIMAQGVRAFALASDMTKPAEVNQLFRALAEWADRLDLIVLNASGGLERQLIAADPDYPVRINRDAQLAIVDGALPLMRSGGTVVYVTSHWAHLYGRVAQLPGYEPVAASKHTGEQALRARQAVLAEHGIRLLVVTGDLVEGTITPKLLERRAPGLGDQRRADAGDLPTTDAMGEAIAAAATDATLASGHTVVVGGALASLLGR